MPKIVVITSGYFNPLHPGHINCFDACKELGDEVRVIVNNDEQSKIKTGTQDIFQDQSFRMTVVSALKSVDRIMLSIDVDTTVCQSINHMSHLIRNEYGKDTQIIFGKGGDRSVDNIPEVSVCIEQNIQIVDGLGVKTHHSSEYRAKRV